VVLATSVSAYALLQSLVIPVLPSIQRGLHTSQNTVTWVLTAYLLSASIFTPIVGRLGDMWGKQKMFVAALGVLVAGCVLSAVATSMTLMIAGRLIQGVGGGVMPLAFGIIRDEFPEEAVAGAVGSIASLTAVGGGFGLVIAGPVERVFSYHWLFWLPAIVLVAAGIAAYRFVPASPVRVPGRVNWLAAVLMSAWLVALLLPISDAAEWGWASGRVIGLLVLAGLLAGTWIWVERRSASPLIDMRMMRLPIVWTTNLVALLMGIGMYATFAFIPQFVQTPTSAGYGFGASIVESGLILLPSNIVMFVVGTSVGRLTMRYGGKRLLVVGTAITVASFIVLLLARDAVWEVIVAMMLQGASFGLAFAAMSTLIVEGVPVEQTGVASGMNANIRTIGGSVGAAVMSTLVAGSAVAGGLPTSSGYNRGFLFLTLGATAAACAAWLVPARRRRLSQQEAKAALPHPEMGVVAAGTLFGDDPE